MMAAQMIEAMICAIEDPEPGMVVNRLSREEVVSASASIKLT